METICLEVLWAGWSQTSDSSPQRGGEWQWGAVGLARGPLWREPALPYIPWLDTASSLSPQTLGRQGRTSCSPGLTPSGAGIDQEGS